MFKVQLVQPLFYTFTLSFAGTWRTGTLC